MKKAVLKTYFCVLIMSLCLVVSSCRTGHKPIHDKSSNQAHKDNSSSQLHATMLLGNIVGIAGFGGKFDPVEVAKKCAEMKASDQPSIKEQKIEECRKMGGIPQDGTGKILRFGPIPTMGGEGCIICWSKKDFNDPNARRLVEAACPEADTEIIK